jgi:hypothetical protein
MADARGLELRDVERVAVHDHLHKLATELSDRIHLLAGCWQRCVAQLRAHAVQIARALI